MRECREKERDKYANVHKCIFLFPLFFTVSFLVLLSERIIEDHESVLEVQSNWGMDSDSRLYFRKNYAKYEFFKKPLVCGVFVVCIVLTHTHKKRQYVLPRCNV